MSLAYTIVGDGRLASHFCFYFSHLQIPFTNWSRKKAGVSELEKTVTGSDVVLLLIKDSEILEFSRQSFLRNKRLVHCSGSLSFEDVYAAHPLMTFSEHLYDLDTYKKIPFIVDEEAREFSEIFPELPNPSYKIKNKDRALYHALCVTGGNFTTLLWQLVFRECRERLNLPEDVFNQYIMQIVENLRKDSEHALTGPFIRNDFKTIELNEGALIGSDLSLIYSAFKDVYFKNKS